MSGQKNVKWLTIIFRNELLQRTKVNVEDKFEHHVIFIDPSDFNKSYNLKVKNINQYIMSVVELYHYLVKTH